MPWGSRRLPGRCGRLPGVSAPLFCLPGYSACPGNGNRACYLLRLEKHCGQWSRCWMYLTIVSIPMAFHCSWVLSYPTPQSAVVPLHSSVPSQGSHTWCFLLPVAGICAFYLWNVSRQLCSIYVPDCQKTPTLYYERYFWQDDDNRGMGVIHVPHTTKKVDTHTFVSVYFHFTDALCPRGHSRFFIVSAVRWRTAP